MLGPRQVLGRTFSRFWLLVVASLGLVLCAPNLSRAQAEAGRPRDPVELGGLRLGGRLAVAQRACEQAGHRWERRSLDEHVCHGPVRSPGFPTAVLVVFGEARVHGIQAFAQCSNVDECEQVWVQMRALLTQFYGEPNVPVSQGGYVCDRRELYRSDVHCLLWSTGGWHETAWVTQGGFHISLAVQVNEVPRAVALLIEYRRPDDAARPSL